MNCKNCGASVGAEYRLCPYCGSEIEYAKEQPQTVVQNFYISDNEHKPKGNYQQSVNMPVKNVNAPRTNANMPIKNPSLAYKKPKKKTNGCLLTFKIACILSFSFLVIFIGSAAIAGMVEGCSANTNNYANNNSSSNNSIWAQGYTHINDFEYSIDDNKLYVGRYKGSDSKIKFNSIYTLDEKECTVVAFDNATFFCKNIDSVIIPEGTKTLANNTFNSCGVKFLYLPKTLEPLDNSFWGYFHGTQKIYYGGTEEEWKNICKVDNSDIDVQEIVYNANIDELK